MPPGPVPQDPGRDEDPRPVPPWPDWMDDPAYLAARAEGEDPGDPDADDPGDAPPPDVDPGELAAEADRITGELAREAALLAGAGLTAAVAADAAAAAGRRGPGMPGSAHPGAGVYASRASGFAPGKPLDTAPGCLRWASSRRRRPGTMTGTRARATRSWPGRSARGTGSRPTPAAASTPRPRS